MSIEHSTPPKLRTAAAWAIHTERFHLCLLTYALTKRVVDIVILKTCDTPYNYTAMRDANTRRSIRRTWSTSPSWRSVVCCTARNDSTSSLIHAAHSPKRFQQANLFDALESRGTFDLITNHRVYMCEGLWCSG